MRISSMRIAALTSSVTGVAAVAMLGLDTAGIVEIPGRAYLIVITACALPLGAIVTASVAGHYIARHVRLGVVLARLGDDDKPPT